MIQKTREMKGPGFYITILMGLMVGMQMAYGQTTYNQSDEMEKNVLAGNILGTGSYIGMSYERIFFQQLSAELGIGLVGFGAGISFYPKKIQAQKTLPYVGLKFTSHAIVDGEHKAVTYLPLGITVFARLPVNLSIDIGPSVVRHISPGYMPTQAELDKFPYTDISIFGNLKLGVRF